MEIKAGQTLEMLGSATLEKMAADAKERSDAMFRIWAKVTKFEGKNYLFAVYYLSLRKIDRPVEETVKNEPNKTSQASTGQAVNAPNDVVNIPAEIVALLKTIGGFADEEAQTQQAETATETGYDFRQQGRASGRQKRWLCIRGGCAGARSREIRD